MQIDEKGLAAAIDAIWRQWKLPEEERLNGATTAPALAHAAISAYLESLKLGSRLTVEGVEAVVVPVEPTLRMQGAMAFYHIQHAGAAEEAEMSLARASYRAMLSAAGDGNA